MDPPRHICKTVWHPEIVHLPKCAEFELWNNDDITFPTQKVIIRLNNENACVLASPTTSCPGRQYSCQKVTWLHDVMLCVMTKFCAPSSNGWAMTALTNRQTDPQILYPRLLMPEGKINLWEMWRCALPSMNRFACKVHINWELSGTWGCNETSCAIETTSYSLSILRVNLYEEIQCPSYQIVFKQVQRFWTLLYFYFPVYWTGITTTNAA